MRRSQDFPLGTAGVSVIAAAERLKVFEIARRRRPLPRGPAPWDGFLLPAAVNIGTRHDGCYSR
jgi:hypothetical protein